MPVILIRHWIKVQFEDVIHDFTIFYDPTCDGNTLDVIGAWESGTYTQDTESSCYNYYEIIDMNNHPIAKPTVETKFLQNEIVVHENEATLKIYTIIKDADACDAWIQLEYDPSLIDEITYVGDQNDVETFNDGDKAIIALNMYDMAEQQDRTDDFIVTFIKENACDTPLMINVYGSHFCNGGEFPMPPKCSDELECMDFQDQTIITILPSELSFEGFDCDSTADECEVHCFSFVLDNQENGDTYNVGLKADLPPGFDIVEAYYHYPYEGELSNCDPFGSTPINNDEIDDFENDGWLIDTDNEWNEGPGFLPGKARLTTDSERNFHIILCIYGGCDIEGEEFMTSFEAFGEHPCGEPIVLPPYESDLNVEPSFVLPEVEIDVEVDIECIGGGAQLLFHIDFLDDDLDVNPDQKFKLEILGGIGYDLLCDLPTDFPYGDATYACDIDLVSSPCTTRLYTGNLILSTCFTRECTGVLCRTQSETLIKEEFNFHPGTQELVISEIIFDDEFCYEEHQENSQIKVILNTEDVEIGSNTTFELWCDANENCRQDIGDVFLQAIDVEITDSPIQEFNFTMTPEQFDMGLWEWTSRGDSFRF